MTADHTKPDCVWKWLQLADQSGLDVSLGALAQRAVDWDRTGCCKEENMQGLSNKCMVHLTRKLAENYTVGSSWYAHCKYCNTQRVMQCCCASCQRDA
jgi:hypothetical protein